MRMEKSEEGQGYSLCSRPPAGATSQNLVLQVEKPTWGNCQQGCEGLHLIPQQLDARENQLLTQSLHERVAALTPAMVLPSDSHVRRRTPTQDPSVFSQCSVLSCKLGSMFWLYLKANKIVQRKTVYSTPMTPS